MAPEHERILKPDDFTEEELRQGRGLLSYSLDLLEGLPPEVPVDFSLSSEDRHVRSLYRRANLDALIIRRSDDKWTPYLLLRQPAMAFELPSRCASKPPASQTDSALDGISAIGSMLLMTSADTPAKARARSANGTFGLVRRSAHSGHACLIRHQSTKEVPMGLDVGYYNQAGEEVLGFRKHHELADLFFAEEIWAKVGDA